MKLLTYAILQDKHGSNPAALYFLGRQAVLVGDAAAADTTFSRAATLAPTCTADIATYREEVGGNLVNDGLSACQDGKQGSAPAPLHVAPPFEPPNPTPSTTAAAPASTR